MQLCIVVIIGQQVQTLPPVCVCIRSCVVYIAKHTYKAKPEAMMRRTADLCLLLKLYALSSLSAFAQDVTSEEGARLNFSRSGGSWGD